jgi:hypothetical protein
MNRLALAVLVLLLLLWHTANAQHHEGRPHYWNPTGLAAQTHNPDNEKLAQSYLMRVFDVTQDSGQSCALKTPATVAQLNQIFSDYLKSHPNLLNAGRSAAGVAAQAYTEYWACKK